MLLSLLSLTHGYNVVIAHHSTMRHYIRYFPRGIYFFKDLAFYKNDLFQYIRSLNNKLVTLDEEAIFSAHNPDRFIEERFSSANLELADRVLCWGRFDYEAMFPKYDKFKEKIIRSGNPRFDIWSNKFNSLYQNQAIEIKKKFGEFILFSSNFSIRSNANGPDYVLKYFEENKIIKNDNDRTKFLKIWEFKDRAFENFLILIPKLARRYKNLKFIIRNHPSEDPKEWNEIADNNHNIIVEQKGSITPYIMASKCILHFGCTSGLEAYFIGKPSLIFAPEKHAEIDNSVSAHLSRVHRSYDSLILDIDKVMTGGVIKNEMADAYFKNNFYYDEGMLFTEKIINEIDSITEPNDIFVGNIEGLKRRMMKQKLKGRIKNTAMLRPARALYQAFRKRTGLTSTLTPSVIKHRQKWPGLTQTEIEETLNTLADILNLKIDIYCDNICDEIFILNTA